MIEEKASHGVESKQSYRYELDQSNPNHWRYGPWHIVMADWIRPHPSVDWDWYNDNYDGADDAGYQPHGNGYSGYDCINEIHEWEDDQAEIAIAKATGQEGVNNG